MSKSDFDLENLDVNDEDLEGVDWDDPDAINAFLKAQAGKEEQGSDTTAQADSDSDKTGETDSDETDSQTGEQPEGDKPADAEDPDKATKSDDTNTGDTDSADPPGAEEESEELYVMTKDGKNKIPYSVLEAERAKASQYKQELDAVRQNLQELEGSSKRMADVLKEQGVDLENMQAGDQLSEDQLAAIKEADPDIAKAIDLLQKQVQAQSEQLQQFTSQPQVDPTELAIRENTDLKAWRNSDPDRWSLAVKYDDELQAIPEWQDKSLEDRFAEAVRRTKLEFGDINRSQKTETRSAEEIAAEKLKKAESTQAPTSLSNIGQTPSTERTLTERLAKLDGDALIEAMDDLSPAKINELLGGVG